MAIKRVLFSFTRPQEGIIDVEAETNEQATKIVMDLMGNNYKDFVIANITDVNVEEMLAMTDDPEETRTVN